MEFAFVATPRKIGNSLMITLPISLVEMTMIEENKPLQFKVITEEKSRKEWSGGVGSGPDG